MSDIPEMVKRGATAIKAKVPYGYGMTDSEAEEYARAVIEAMMEPNKSMVFFGMDAMSRDDLEPTEGEFRAGFQAAMRADAAARSELIVGLIETGRKLVESLPAHWHDEAVTDFLDTMSQAERFEARTTTPNQTGEVERT